MVNQRNRPQIVKKSPTSTDKPFETVGTAHPTHSRTAVRTAGGSGSLGSSMRGFDLDEVVAERRAVGEVTERVAGE